MKAIYYTRFGERPSIEDVSDPICPKDGVILKVAASGLCLSDWHGWQGHDSDNQVPHVPGHEFAGVIVEVGEKCRRRFHLGQRVGVPFIQACGHCRQCQQGHTQVCEDQLQAGFTSWGSHAQYVAVSRARQNLIVLPDQIGFDSAALMGCRFGTAMHAVSLAQDSVGHRGWWVVFGCGGVGQSIVWIAAALGFRVLAVDLHPNALRRAKELGALHGVQSQGEHTVQHIRDLTADNVAVTFDAYGSYSIIREALTCLSPRGAHVQVGLLPPSDRDQQIPLSTLIARELQLVGCHGIPRATYPRLLGLIEEHALDPAKLVTKTLSLEAALNPFVHQPSLSEGGPMIINPNSE